MKIKKIGKLATLVAASTALVVSLIQDKKSKKDNNE